jgi:hypothetical protein
MFTPQFAQYVIRHFLRSTVRLHFFLFEYLAPFGMIATAQQTGHAADINRSHHGDLVLLVVEHFAYAHFGFFGNPVFALYEALAREINQRRTGRDCHQHRRYLSFTIQNCVSS